MDGAEADRTQEGSALSALDDEDVVAVLRTGKVATLDPYTVEDAIPTTPALPISPEGTQEIHADDVLEVLEGRRRIPPPPAPRVARVARVVAERTQEIRAVDILEEVPAARVSEDIPVDVDDEPVQERRPGASSIAPLAIEVERPVLRPVRVTPTLIEAASSASFVARIGPPRRLRLIVEVTMAASLLILAAGALRAHFSPTDGDATPIVLVDESGRSTAGAPPAAVDVKNIPLASTAPTTGTIARTTSAKLSVDGVPISGVSAMVPCGPHLIKVGSEKPRKVDVPCGGTLSVDPQRH
jgi:hypothetical protein